MNPGLLISPGIGFFGHFVSAEDDLVGVGVGGLQALINFLFVRYEVSTIF
jgi:hypothetical protein